MTATQRLPTMKPMLAMSSWPGASSGRLRAAVHVDAGLRRARLHRSGKRAAGARHRQEKAPRPRSGAASRARQQSADQFRPFAGARDFRRGRARARVRARGIMRLGDRVDGIDASPGPAGFGRRRIARSDSRSRKCRSPPSSSGTPARLDADVRNVVRGNDVARSRIDLKARAVGMADADEERFGVLAGRRRTSPSVPPARRARRRGAAAARFHPGAAHLESAVGSSRPRREPR